MTLSQEILEGTYQGVEKYLQQNAPVNILDEYGYTPLIHAVAMNQFETVSLLLKHHARVELVDITGSTALHWAVDNDNLSICQLLLQYGANPNAYNSNGQPILFYPLLRKNRPLIDLLIKHGANVEFAKDFINAKLLAHRFELRGNSDLVTPEGLFISIDLEGFYLEFTLGIIRESLARFTKSYLAHRLSLPIQALNKIMMTLDRASQLREFRHFSKEVSMHQETINELIETDLLLLPISYAGHAITFIKHGPFFAKCDRGVHKMTDPIVIHTIDNLEKCNNAFYTHLLYEKHTDHFMKVVIPLLLGLQPYASLPIKHQITGNCSWANVEASVATMLYMLLHDQRKPHAPSQPLIDNIMDLYHTWLEWDKDRALEEWLEDFEKKPFQKQKAKAALLGAIFFQALTPNQPDDIVRAKKILAVLSKKEFHYIVRIYANIFIYGHKTSKGKASQQLIEACGYKLSQFSY